MRLKGSEMQIVKYPRTRHLEGSTLQAGDAGSDQTSIKDLLAAHEGCSFIIEEKLDGANSGISFDGNLDLNVQSRGHVLTGGAREAQFDLLKQWASLYESTLLERLEDRYIMYGEWCFARHTTFYDALPHYFHEFDIWDRQQDKFLSTPARHALLDGSPVISVPVVKEGWPKSRKDLAAAVGVSAYRTPDWRDSLAEAAERAGVDPAAALAEGGDSDLAEGLYVKIEKDDRVVDRLKWVRPGFLQTILESGSHWHSRPIIRNGLSGGVDILASPAGLEMWP